MERKVHYFENPGKENTPACIDIVKYEVEENDYKNVIIASSTGETGLSFATALKGIGANIVVVTHASGFTKAKAGEITDEMRRNILDNGATVFTGSMPTHSLDSAFSGKHSGVNLTQIVSQVLHLFGDGLTACCEIAMMATDGGLVPEGVEALCVAGSGSGADTVAVIRATASKRFLDLKVMEILAKPRG